MRSEKESVNLGGTGHKAVKGDFKEYEREKRKRMTLYERKFEHISSAMGINRMFMMTMMMIIMVMTIVVMVVRFVGAVNSYFCIVDGLGLNGGLKEERWGMGRKQINGYRYLHKKSGTVHSDKPTAEWDFYFQLHI